MTKTKTKRKKKDTFVVERGTLTILPKKNEKHHKEEEVNYEGNE
jgi:hypothetical protein